MIKNKIDRGHVLQSQLLSQYSGIEHFCSMKDCLSPGKDVWMPKQVHGTNIVIVDETTPNDLNAELQAIDADAVITRLSNQWIGVRTADCVPVLLYDPVAKVIAAVHAGWRGTVKHIVSSTVRKMKQEMNCSPTDLVAVVGPSISPEVFEVGEEVAENFVLAGREECILREMWGKKGKYILPKPHIDLWQSNVMDLLDEGVSLEHIDCTPWCTFEHHDELFSARKEGIGTGRIVSAIEIVC